MFAEQKIFPIFVPPKDINEQRHETDYIKIYPSTNIHCVNPSCEYYVFAMRKIVI